MPASPSTPTRQQQPQFRPAVHRPVEPARSSTSSLGTVSATSTRRRPASTSASSCRLMYGSDARIIHTLGVFDQLIHDRNQLDVVEADVSARIPQPVRQRARPQGRHLPDADGRRGDRPQGQPVLLALLHLQLRPAVQAHRRARDRACRPTCSTSISASTPARTPSSPTAPATTTTGPAASPASASTSIGGNLTVLALTHIGPEDSKHLVPFANSALRYFNDVAVVWKTTDKLTLTGRGQLRQARTATGPKATAPPAMPATR